MNLSMVKHSGYGGSTCGSFLGGMGGRFFSRFSSDRAGISSDWDGRIFGVPLSSSSVIIGEVFLLIFLLERR